jgi:hypothetical protein
MVPQTLIATGVWMQDLSESEKHRARLVVLVGCPIRDSAMDCSALDRACAFVHDQKGWWRLNRCEKELLEIIRKGEYDYDRRTTTMP